MEEEEEAHVEPTTPGTRGLEGENLLGHTEAGQHLRSGAAPQLTVTPCVYVQLSANSAWPCSRSGGRAAPGRGATALRGLSGRPDAGGEIRCEPCVGARPLTAPPPPGSPLEQCQTHRNAAGLGPARGPGCTPTAPAPGPLSFKLCSFDSVLSAVCINNTLPSERIAAREAISACLRLSECGCVHGFLIKRSLSIKSSLSSLPFSPSLSPLSLHPLSLHPLSPLSPLSPFFFLFSEGPGCLQCVQRSGK